MDGDFKETTIPTSLYSTDCYFEIIYSKCVQWSRKLEPGHECCQKGVSTNGVLIWTLCRKYAITEDIGISKVKHAWQFSS